MKRRKHSEKDSSLADELGIDLDETDPRFDEEPDLSMLATRQQYLANHFDMRNACMYADSHEINNLTWENMVPLSPIPNPSDPFTEINNCFKLGEIDAMKITPSVYSHECYERLKSMNLERVKLTYTNPIELEAYSLSFDQHFFTDAAIDVAYYPEKYTRHDILKLNKNAASMFVNKAAMVDILNNQMYASVALMITHLRGIDPILFNEQNGVMLYNAAVGKYVPPILSYYRHVMPTDIMRELNGSQSAESHFNDHSSSTPGTSKKRQQSH